MSAPLALRFSGVTDAAQAQRYVVRVRFAEALRSQSALESGDDERLHAFRLCCKRLRFAIERLEAPSPGLDRAAALLSKITDELGFAHDCAQLIDLAKETPAPLVQARAKRDRDRYVGRAARLWNQAFVGDGEFAPLAAYAGFTWSAP
ncbi:MAG TPA: CHAD domain-containing protein [Candidatus Baltobacteraceae bacterium]